MRNSYNEYIMICFTWDDAVLTGVDRVWGFPATPHGLIHVILSDYYDKPCGTIISTAMSIIDPDTSDDLIKLALKELRLSYPMLPDPTTATRDTRDLTAYIAGLGTTPVGPRSLIKGIWSVGSHNQATDYAFTTIETAVASAMKFADVNPLVPVISLGQMIFVLLMILIVIISLGNSSWHAMPRRISGLGSGLGNPEILEKTDYFK